METALKISFIFILALTNIFNFVLIREVKASVRENQYIDWTDERIQLISELNSKLLEKIDQEKLEEIMELMAQMEDKWEAKSVYTKENNKFREVIDTAWQIIFKIESGEAHEIDSLLVKINEFRTLQ